MTERLRNLDITSDIASDQTTQRFYDASTIINSAGFSEKPERTDGCMTAHFHLVTGHKKAKVKIDIFVN